MTIFFKFVIVLKKKIYHYNHFLSVQFSNDKDIHVVVQPITRTILSYKTEILYPLNNSLFPSPLGVFFKCACWISFFLIHILCS